MTNRTGSTWLCNMLDLAGPGYTSGEWMGPRNRLSPFDRDDPKSVSDHWLNLQRIDAGVTKNLVVKLNYPQFTKFIPQSDQIDPEHRFVFLTRDNKVEQAISQFALELTAKGQSLTLKSLDPERITGLVAIFEKSNAQWAKWYAENGTQPYVLCYEEMRARPKQHVAGILKHFGDDDFVNSEQFAALPEKGLEVSNPVNKLSYRTVWVAAMDRYMKNDPDWHHELDVDVPHDVFIDRSLAEK